MNTPPKKMSSKVNNNVSLFEINDCPKLTTINQQLISKPKMKNPNQKFKSNSQVLQLKKRDERFKIMALTYNGYNSILNVF